MPHSHFKVLRLTCKDRASSVEKVIAEMVGVRSTQSSLGTRDVTVYFDERITSSASIELALATAGFEVEIDRGQDPGLLDKRVSADVVSECKKSKMLHYAQLTLRVENGVVTISGQVNSKAQLRAIQDAVYRVAGARTLILEVRDTKAPVTQESPSGSSASPLLQFGQFHLGSTTGS